MGGNGKDSEFMKFPDGFMWSAAAASYQIEGAWNEDGKGESVWDVFSHTPGNIYNNENGDIACDSYHKIKEDVEALKKLGVSYYRFSISWPRILPKGSTESMNEKGVDYYNRLINALLENNIQPLVTLFHWDLPQCLQEKFGGWLSRDIVKCFVDYADVCFRLFGDRVKWWNPINEPTVIASMSYGSGSHAPGVKNPIGFSLDVCHHLIISHVEVWHLYNDKYRALQKGKIGMGLHSDWAEPFSSSPEDLEASSRLMKIKVGLICDPVCLDGDYSDLMKERFETLKKLGIVPHDITLPCFTDEEKIRNKGSLDFFGLNYYTSRIARNIDDTFPPITTLIPFLCQLARADELIDPSWKRAASSWLYSVPWGLRKLIHYMKSCYGNVPIFILENGFSDSDGKLDDEGGRIDYMRSHLEVIWQAITEDQANVVGYTYWSLMDNFEWSKGYSEQFGLFRVDQRDPERRRLAKKSAGFYADIIRNNGLKMLQ